MYGGNIKLLGVDRIYRNLMVYETLKIGMQNFKEHFDIFPVVINKVENCTLSYLPSYTNLPNYSLEIIL